jgi:hypothetical protein
MTTKVHSDPLEFRFPSPASNSADEAKLAARPRANRTAFGVNVTSDQADRPTLRCGGCVASPLTAREVSKCLPDGVSGSGSFGNSNDLVGRDGWVSRTLGQIAGGPNSAINNPNQIWGATTPSLGIPAKSSAVRTQKNSEENSEK